MPKCVRCLGEGFRKTIINEVSRGVILVKEWCEKCHGNGYNPPIVTMEQFCSVKKDSEGE